MLYIEVVVADGVVKLVEVNGDEPDEVIEAVKKLRKELGTKTSLNVCKGGRWVEASG